MTQAPGRDPVGKADAFFYMDHRLWFKYYLSQSNILGTDCIEKTT